MKIFNIGTQELLLLFILMFLVLGPERMKKSGKSLVRIIHRITRSETWRSFIGIYKEVKTYPEKLAEEFDLEEIQEDLNANLYEIQKDINKELSQTENNLLTLGNETKSSINDLIRMDISDYNKSK